MVKKNTYNYDSQKRYNDKNKIYSIKYLPSEFDVVNQIEKACERLNMSKQSFIKIAIIEKLERDNNVTPVK